MEISVHPFLYGHLNAIGAKRTMLRAGHSDLATIVLGSSHGDYGFNPDFYPGSFNLCCSSQDLRHSFLSYKHVAESYKNITHVVLFYSVFSSGWDLLRNPSEKYVSAAMNELFNFGIEYDDEELKNEFLKVKGKLEDLKFESDGHCGFMPNHAKTYFQNSYGAARRAADHLRWNESIAENLHLIRLILLAKHNGHKVCVVVPPARSDYKRALNKSFGSLFGPLLEILYGFHLGVDVKLVNAFESDLFDDSYFGDFDHLLPSGKGVEVLTKLISETVAPQLENGLAASVSP